MATAATVSNYILSLLAPGRQLETVKLQKLLYFCQGWSFGLRNEALFEEDFEAWKYGPVVREVYAQHAGEYRIPETHKFRDRAGVPGSHALSDEEKRLVELVVHHYGALNTFKLVDMAHVSGGPWHKVHDSSGFARTISKDSIREWFEQDAERLSRTG